LALRARQQRNLLATLLLSQGVPMILHGDEIGRTQRGNNNAYCQDNDLTWVDWQHPDTDLLEFTRMLTDLRRRHPIFRRQRFFQGRRIESWHEVPDISWLRPTGEPMTDEDWHVGYAKTLTVVLNGAELNERDRFGQPLRDSSFSLFFNASEVPAACLVPGRTSRMRWRLVFDTAAWPPAGPPAEMDAGVTRTVEARSLVVLQEIKGE
jgi:glycogen operon protein